MHDVYTFLTGPLAVASLLFFSVGMLARAALLVGSVFQKERFILSYLSLHHGLNSLLHWITPFAARNMRRHPVVTIVTFLFHICLLCVPVFLLSHIVLWDEAMDISWWALPDPVADIMTILVIGACFFLGVRRIILPEVRYLTYFADFGLLVLVCLPFVTGLWAYHQLPGYAYVLLLHILSGELLLMAIPITRLSHMLLGVFTRFYMGCEFGGVRHAKDW